MKVFLQMLTATAICIFSMFLFPDILWASEVEYKNVQWNMEEVDLTLQYDDRYSFSDMIEGYSIISIENEEITSYQVSGGCKTKEFDMNVVSLNPDSENDIIATGVGRAVVLLVPKESADEASALISGQADPEWSGTIRALQVNVTVQPARLTLMYVAGQSNAEGLCSSNTGYQLDKSISCDPGTVYSTYAPSNNYSESIIGRNLSSYCTSENAADFVAGALRGTESISGTFLTYAVDSLTSDGMGKTGPDSGLAYEWNRLTGDKVWIVNTAWNGTSISSWMPGEKYYERSAAVYNLVQQTYQAEIAAGHYQEGETLLFWLQGEADKNMSAENYKTSFYSMCSSMQQEFNLDAFGIIMVRKGSNANEDENVMTGPRAVQYAAGGDLDLPNVFVVSNVNEQWISDAEVSEYFGNAYEEGYLTYPVHGTSGTLNLPVTVAEVHNDIHYSQIGHNENGLTAAKGMYEALYSSFDEKSIGVLWKNEAGEKISQLRVIEGEQQVLVPVTDPIYCAKKVHYILRGTAVSYDKSLNVIKGETKGAAMLYAYDEKGKVISWLVITVADPLDLSSVAGRNYTGLFYYNDEWWYLKNGWIQKDYYGVVQNGGDWWRVEEGKVNFDYNGIAQNENGWWYIRGGKVNFGYTGVAQNENGWWRIEKGKVNFSYNGIAQNENGWWYIRSGKVNFDYTGVAQNENGWWRIEKGKVNFNYNGIAQNENGWWYIRSGKVNFNYTGIAQNENGWWRIEKGKVNFNYSGVAQNENGWWYIKNGKVDFSYNGIAQNENGWWYIKNGKVDFGFTGQVRVGLFSYHVKNGCVMK